MISKKSVTGLLLGLLLTLACTAGFVTDAYAMLRADQGKIASLNVGMTARGMEAMRNTCGIQEYEKEKIGKNRYAYRYFDGVYVETVGNEVNYIATEKDHAATFDGLKVNQSLQDVEDRLGRADKVEGNLHIYYVSGENELCFIYDKNKIVRRIFSGTSYEEIKQKEKKDRKNKTDVGDEIQRRTRQVRDIFWTAEGIFGRHRPYWW